MVVKAVAVLGGTTGAGKGVINFSQEGQGPPMATINLTQFSENGLFQLIVHVHGDITDPPDSMGPTFKDLGSITVNCGNAYSTFSPSGITLSEPDSIIGRAFAVHKDGIDAPAVIWGVIGLTE